MRSQKERELVRDREGKEYARGRIEKEADEEWKARMRSKRERELVRNRIEKEADEE